MNLKFRNTVRRYLSIVCLTFAISLFCNAQEIVTTLCSNPVLEHYVASQSSSKKKSAKLASDTLSLPFFEDFSTSDIYPDQSKWKDKQVFINSVFAKDMISVGVATFDAINQSGSIYSNASSITFPADTLTSKPFNLSKSNDPNVYLSFYYQPQGISDAPEDGDSLVLEFYSPKDTIWLQVWSKHGSDVYPFKQAIVAVADTLLQAGFQFRFRNYASLAVLSDEPAKRSNADMWHIDYIKLDKNRSDADTIPADVAMARPMSSLLKNYQSMPLDHYILGFRNEIKANISMFYRNNDNKANAIDRYFKITDLISPSSDGPTFIDAGHTFVASYALDSVTYDLENPFNTLSTDSARFEVKSFLNTNTYDVKTNDTARFIQYFGDYFAYDDGSCEAGWGLLGQGSQNGMVAYGFKTYKADSIYGVAIYFNPSEDEANQDLYFQLTVWGDTKGLPGTILYTEANDNYYPRQVAVNQFYNYRFEKAVGVGQKFYVGWKQVYNDSYDSYLNVGLDLNTNSLPNNLFFNITGTWEKTKYTGSLMVRPIFKPLPLDATSVKTTTSSDIKVYPNPANETINIQLSSNTSQTEGAIYDTRGRLAIRSRVSNNQIDVSQLPNGLYILKLSDENTTFAPVKILIQH